MSNVADKSSNISSADPPPIQMAPEVICEGEQHCLHPVTQAKARLEGICSEKHTTNCRWENGDQPRSSMLFKGCVIASSMDTGICPLAEKQQWRTLEILSVSSHLKEWEMSNQSPVLSIRLKGSWTPQIQSFFQIRGWGVPTNVCSFQNPTLQRLCCVYSAASPTLFSSGASVCVHRAGTQAQDCLPGSSNFHYVLLCLLPNEASITTATF